MNQPEFTPDTNNLHDIETIYSFEQDELLGLDVSLSGSLNTIVGSLTIDEPYIIDGSTSLKVLGDLDITNLGSIVGNGVGDLDDLSIDVEGKVTINGDIGGSGLQSISITADEGFDIDGANIELTETSSDISFIVNAGIDVPSWADLLTNPLYKDISATGNIDINNSVLSSSDITLITNTDTTKYTKIDIFEDGLVGFLTGEPLATMSTQPDKIGLTFDESATGVSTITRTSGSWITDEFEAGQEIKVVGSDSNDDNSYTIDSVTSDTITLIDTDDLIDEVTSASVDSVTIQQVFTSLLPEEVPVTAEDVDGTLIDVGDVTFEDISDILKTEIAESGVLDLSLPVEALFSDTQSLITIGSGAQLLATNDITVEAAATSDITLETPSMILGAAYVSSGATAKTDVQNGAIISAGNNLQLQSLVTNYMTAGVSTASNMLLDLAGQYLQVPGPQISFAYGKGRSTSETNIEDGVTITTGNADIQSKNTNRFNVYTETKGKNKAGFGLTIGVPISDTESTSNTNIDGQITATGDVVIDAEAHNALNTTKANTVLKKNIIKDAVKNAAKDQVKSFLQSQNITVPGSVSHSNKPIADIAGGVIVVESVNEAQSYIQDNAVIQVDGNLDVTATAEENFRASAISQAKLGADVSLGGAVAVTNYTNQANALIGSATVDVGGQLNVKSDAQIPNQILIDDDLQAILDLDPSLPSLDGSSPTAFYESVDSYLIQLNQDFDTLARIIPYINTNLGVADKIATSFVGAAAETGESGKFALSGSINLLNVTNEAQATILEGALINNNNAIATADQSVAVEALTSIETINIAGIPSVEYLILPNSKSAGSSVGGTYNQISYNNNTTAFIDDGAEVNAQKDVNVLADATNFTVNVLESGGSAEDFGVSGTVGFNKFINNTYAYIEDQAKVIANNKIVVDSQTDVYGLMVGGSFMSSDNVGVGAAVSLNEADNDTQAFIGNLNSAGLAIAGLVDAGTDLEVNANSKDEFLTISLAGTLVSDSTPDTPTTPDADSEYGDGDSASQSVNTDDSSATVDAAKQKAGASISGDVSLNTINTTTRAFISDIADVNIGNDLTIDAQSDGFLLSVAGAFALEMSKGSGGVAIAGSFTENDVTRDTRAFTENTDITANNVTLNALSKDHLISITAGGAGALNDGTASVAGSVNLNFGDSTTIAALGDNTQLTATGTIDLETDYDQLIVSVAGGVSVTDGKAGVGAAVDVGIINNTVQSYIGQNANITSSQDIKIKAQSKQQVISVGASLAVSTKLLGLSGSASSQNLDTTVLAFIDELAQVNTTQNILIDANSEVEVIAVGGSAAFGKTAGIGAALGNSNFKHTVKAYIGNNAQVTAKGEGTAISDPSNTLTGNGIILDATGTENLYLVGAGGAGGKTLGFAASAVVNTMDNLIEAYIGQNAVINGDQTNADTDQSVQLRADNTTNILSVAGSIAGAGTVGVGAAADVEVITKQVKAYIAGGAQVNALNNILLTADSLEDILSIAASAVGASTAAIAGTGSVITLNNTTQAFIDTGATAITEGNIGIFADNETEIDGISGNITASGSASVGASAVVTVIDKTTEAFVGDSATVQAKALRDQGITAKTGKFDISFSNDTGSETSEVQAPGAHDADVNEDGTNDVNNNALTQQRVATAQSQTLKGLAIAATNKDDLETIAASGGISGSVAVNLSGDVNVMKSNTSAYIGENAQINANNESDGAEQSVLVAAGNDYYHLGIAAVGSVGGTAGITPGGDVTIIENTTKAYIDDNVTLNAQKDLTVIADAKEDILSIAAGVAVSGTASISGSASVTDINNTTYAYIGDQDTGETDGVTVNVGGDINVSAQNNTETMMIAGSLGVGIGAAGIGGAVGVVTIKKDTQSFIGHNSIVNAQGDIIVSANSVEHIFNLGASAAAGFYAGLAGGVSVESIDSDTTAFIGNSSQINQDLGSLGSVQVLATNDLTVFAFGGGLGAGIAGIGGGVDVGIDKNDTSAYIGNSTDVYALLDVDVQATSTKDIETYGISGAVGIAAVAGSVSVWSLGTERNSSYSDDGSTEDSLTAKDYDNDGDQATADANGFDNTINESGNGNSEFSTLLQGYGRSDTDNVATRLDSTIPDVTSALAGPDIPSGTVAVIGDANITAGNDITVQAQETLNFDAIVGSVAGGIVGIGGSVVVTTLNTNTDAYVDSNAILLAGNDITVKAQQDKNYQGNAYAGQIGLVAIGAQVVVLDDTSNQTAYLNDSVEVQSGNTVTVEAVTNSNLNVESIGGQVGGVALGASIATASSTGSTQAIVGNQVDIGQEAGLSVNNLSVNAQNNSQVDANAIAVAVGIVSGSGSVAEASATPTVNAEIGDNALIDLDQNVDLNGSANGTITTNAEGYNAGVVTAGISSANAQWTPIVNAAVGQSSQVIADGAIALQALNTSQVSADSASTAGGLVGGTGSLAKAIVNSAVQMDIGQSAELNALQTVLIQAQSNNVTSADADGNAYGLAAAGVTKTESQITDAVSIVTGQNSVIDGNGDVTLIATSDNNAQKSKANGGTGGILAGASTEAIANVNSNTTVTIGTGSQITSEAGNLTIEATNAIEAHSEGDIETGGLVTFNQTKADTDVTANTQVTIDDTAQLKGQNIDLNAKVTKLDADTDSYSKTIAADSTTQADAFLDVISQVDIVVANAADIAATEDLNLIARQDGVDTDSDALAAIEVGLTGTVEAEARNDFDLDSDIDLQAGSQLAGENVNLEAESPEDQSAVYSRDAEADAQTVVNYIVETIKVVEKVTKKIPIIGWIVKWVTKTVTNIIEQVLNSNELIKLEGDFFSDNSITFNGDILQGSALNPQLTVNADYSFEIDGDITAQVVGDDVVVDDIANDNPGSVVMSSPGGTVSGNGTIHKNGVFASITLINNSDKNLKLNNISVVNRNPDEPDVNINAETDTSDFSFVTDVTDEPLIDIDNNLTSNVIFAGEIDNATGIVDVLNQGGDLINLAEASTAASQFDLNTPLGDIGESDTPLNLLLYKDVNNPTLSADAGGNIYLATQLLEIRTTETEEPEAAIDGADINGITAGGEIAITAAVSQASIASADPTVEDELIDVTSSYYFSNIASTGADVTLTLDQNTDLYLNGDLSAIGTVSLITPGAIFDNDDSGFDISGGALLMQADTVDALETAVNALEAAIATGDFIIENTGALTIGGISDTDGVQTPATIQITTFSPLTVTETLSATGDITLTATDSAAVGDDLTITASAVLSAAEGNILLQGGDDITIERNGTNPVIQAAGEVLIQGDYGNADPDVGSVMTISGEISAFSVTIQGDSDDDIVDASLISADLLIEGFAGDDYLASGSGEDTLIGGEGEDTLDGGDGTDLATYKDATTSVYINLSTGRGYRGESYGDRFINLENLEGSEFNDIIKGDNQVNLLLGLGGNDRIFGYGDDDTIEAGEGADIVRGGDGNDFLDGGEGDDSMLGDRGDDTMMGGLGDDFLRDGVGDNVFAISDDDATDKIVDFSRSNNAIALLNGLLSDDVDLLQDSSNTQIMFNNLILATLLRTNPAIVRFVDLDLI